MQEILGGVKHILTRYYHPPQKLEIQSMLFVVVPVDGCLKIPHIWTENQAAQKKNRPIDRHKTLKYFTFQGTTSTANHTKRPLARNWILQRTSEPNSLMPDSLRPEMKKTFFIKQSLKLKLKSQDSRVKISSNSKI